MVVGGQLVAERDPGRGEDRVGHVEEDRADQEPDEVEGLALAARQLPEQGEDDAGGDRPDEDVRPAPAPPRCRVVGDVAHQRVGERVGEARQRPEQADQRRVHAEAEVQDDHHAAAGRGEQVVDEGAQPVDDLAAERNPIFGRRLVVGGMAHGASSYTLTQSTSMVCGNVVVASGGPTNPPPTATFRMM